MQKNKTKLIIVIPIRRLFVVKHAVGSGLWLIMQNMSDGIGDGGDGSVAGVAATDILSCTAMSLRFVTSLPSPGHGLTMAGLPH